VDLKLTVPFLCGLEDEERIKSIAQSAVPGVTLIHTNPPMLGRTRLLATKVAQTRTFVSETTVRDVKRMATKDHIVKLVPVRNKHNTALFLNSTTPFLLFLTPSFSFCLV
jgi:hypothetical protein